MRTPTGGGERGHGVSPSNGVQVDAAYRNKHHKHGAPAGRVNGKTRIPAATCPQPGCLASATPPRATQGEEMVPSRTVSFPEGGSIIGVSEVGHDEVEMAGCCPPCCPNGEMPNQSRIRR